MYIVAKSLSVCLIFWTTVSIIVLCKKKVKYEGDHFCNLYTLEHFDIYDPKVWGLPILVIGQITSTNKKLGNNLDYYGSWFLNPTLGYMKPLVKNIEPEDPDEKMWSAERNFSIIYNFAATLQPNYITWTAQYWDNVWGPYIEGDDEKVKFGPNKIRLSFLKTLPKLKIRVEQFLKGENFSVTEFVATNIVINMSLILPIYKLEYLRTNSDKVQVWWYDGCTKLAKTNQPELLHKISKAGNHRFTAVLAFEVDETLTESPFDCDNHDLNKDNWFNSVLGIWESNTTTRDGIGNVRVTRLKTKFYNKPITLRVNYTGSPNFKYCTILYNGNYTPTGNEKCEDEQLMETSKHFFGYTRFYYRNTTVLFIIENDVSIKMNYIFVLFRTVREIRLFCNC